jgi:deoxycytidylate deaminase
MLSLQGIIIGLKNTPEYIEWDNLNIYSKSTHAEMMAILQFLKKHKKTPKDKDIPKFPKKIYVMSFNKNNILRNSKPCSDCLKLLKFYGIKKVVYSVYDNIITEKIENIKDVIVTRGNK